MSKPSLGEIISTNRRKQRLTQKALADQLNVTDKAVSKWERNVARPDINTIPKLAEILDVPVEELINIPVSTKVKEEPADEEKTAVSSNTKLAGNDEYNLEVYRERVRQLLVKGFFGFIAGFLFALMMEVGDGESINFLFTFLVGFAMAGVPYGWELMERIIGRWFVVSHIAIMIIVFFVKLAAALLISWVAYPIALLYNAIKAQRKGSKLKIVFIILLIIVIAWLLLLFGVIDFNGQKEKPSDVTAAYDNVTPTYAEETVAAVENRYITDETLITTSDMFYVVVDKAGEYVLAEENGQRESNYEIVIPSSLQAAYFLTEADPENKYYDFGTGTFVDNAILVIGHYNVNIANTSPRDEWVICVFPNFVINADGEPSYDETNEYCEYLQADSLEKVYTWMSEEYEGMNIVPLDVPLS